MKHEVKEFQNRNKDFPRSSDQEMPEYYLDDQRLLELQDLCQNLNPYQELSLEERLKLQEFGIHDHSNPFAITNQLLMILENNLQYREKNDSKSTDTSSQRQTP